MTQNDYSEKSKPIMKIEQIEVSEIFKRAVKKAVIDILGKKQDSVILESPFSDFIVSFDRNFNKKILFVFKPEELSIEKEKKVFVFFLKSY